MRELEIREQLERLEVGRIKGEQIAPLPGFRVLEPQDENLTIILYMAATTHSIEVNAPLRAVYNQWTQFKDFPLFMEGVEQVRQEGEKRLFWKAKIGGKTL